MMSELADQKLDGSREGLGPTTLETAQMPASASKDSLSKTIEFYESPEDLSRLGPDKFRLHVAHAVLSRGKPLFNMDWKSFDLSPKTLVTWQSDYALNWTTELPSHPSDPITLYGSWQPCQLGEAFDMDPMGQWLRSKATALPGRLMVGLNQYKGPKIFIIIGLKDEYDITPVSQRRPTRGVMTVLSSSPNSH